MNYSPANGEAMPNDTDNQIERKADKELTFGERIVDGLDSLSWKLTNASDEDLLSVAYAFSDKAYDENALLAVSDFNGSMEIRHEIQMALAFVRARPKRKAFICTCA